MKMYSDKEIDNMSKGQLYGFKTEKLFDFLDLYMRLYNK